MSLQAVAYPNPIEQDFTVAINGAVGQDIRLRLVDLQGRRQIAVADPQHRESMSLNRHQPGIYYAEQDD